MTSKLASIPPSRVWVALVLVALVAFAACAVGAADCAMGKPVGLAAALGAAVVSFFDTGTATDTAEAPADREG